MRAILLLLMLAVWLPAGAAAQSLFEPAPPPEATPAEDPDAAQVLLDILRDDQAREALIRQLEIAAEEVAAEPPPVVPRMSLARRIAEYTRSAAEDATAVVTGLLSVGREFVAIFTGDRAVDWPGIQNAALALAFVVGVTIAFFFVLRAIGHRIFREMAARANGGGWFRALVRLVVSSLIDAGTIVLAWAGGYVFALATGLSGTMDFRQSLFLNAFLLVEMTKVFLRMIFSPNYGRLRFAPMSDITAGYWYFWSSRLASLLGYGILLVVPIVNAAVSFQAGNALTVLIALTALLVATLIILQNRGQVREALSARNRRLPDDLIGRLEAAVAGVWHWLAIAYLIALFVVWVTRPQDAIQFMLWATLRSALAVVLGVAAMVLITRAVAGGLRLPPDVKQSVPLLEERINAYVPSILVVIRALVIFAVIVSIGQSWQVVDFLGWAATEVGRDVVSRILSAALVVLIAIALWIGVSSFVEYRLNPVVGTAPTARERTLLSLFRNAFMIFLVVIVTMLTLSELGVNIAPLLAGAGVVGLAVGFGAQKLVQDIITGAFIQFENAMNEGDVVSAGGITGVVERLTIRSVGLRDLTGTYHLIPFSSVNEVSNFMHGFGFHVAEVGVAYREDVAEVKELMFKAFEILRAGELGQHLLADLDMQGVTEFRDSAVIVRARIKTAPGMQWAVGRTWNEIIKRVLDDAGVEIPFPHVTLYMGQGRDGSAPPLNIRRLGESGKEALPAPDSPAPRRASKPRRRKGEPAERVPPSHEEAHPNAEDED